MEVIERKRIKDLPLDNLLNDDCEFEVYIKSDNMEIYEINKNGIFEIALIRATGSIYKAIKLKELIENEEDILYMSVSFRLTENELIETSYRYINEKRNKIEQLTKLN